MIATQSLETINSRISTITFSHLCFEKDTTLSPPPLLCSRKDGGIEGHLCFGGTMTVVSRHYGFYSEQVVTRNPAIVRVYLDSFDLLLPPGLSSRFCFLRATVRSAG